MSSDVITIDFSGVLTEEQLAKIEEETNRKMGKRGSRNFLSEKGRTGASFLQNELDRKSPSRTVSEAGVCTPAELM